MKQDYRSRCYDAFVSTKWQDSHKSTKKAYDFYSLILKKRMKHILPDSRGIRIIDLACGAGHFLYFLQHEGYKDTQGIDLSDEMLKLSSKMGIKNLKKADIFKFLPDNKNQFDLIIANDIIEHLTKDEVILLLDLIYQSLKPGGMVLISTINAMSLFGYGTIQNEFTHVTGFTPMSLTQVLKICHFSNIKTMGEGPVEQDMRSKIRSVLWKMIKLFLRFFITIERGTGRGIWKNQLIFDTRFFSIAKKVECQ
ncbi:MAG: class I SAM-dependent methyltransferase [Spirochaetales bacterium]|nr:class I SAM-dependent methyltransferase [Spirochaetales bacterium]